MGNLGLPEILIIALVIILLFGARKLPEMARSIGKSAKAFKEETKGLRDDDKTPDKTPDRATDTVATPPPVQQPAPPQPQQLPQAQPTVQNQQVNGSQPAEQVQQNKNAG